MGTSWKLPAAFLAPEHGPPFFLARVEPVETKRPPMIAGDFFRLAFGWVFPMGVKSRKPILYRPDSGENSENLKDTWWLMVVSKLGYNPI